MPLYEYECDACSHRFEMIRRFSDPPVTTCPSCGGAVRKLLSSPAIQFKGTGWYITDYARKESSKGKTEGAQSDGVKRDGDGAAAASGDAAKTTPSTGTSSSGQPAREPAGPAPKNS